MVRLSVKNAFPIHVTGKIFLHVTVRVFVVDLHIVEITKLLNECNNTFLN